MTNEALEGGEAESDDVCADCGTEEDGLVLLRESIPFSVVYGVLVLVGLAVEVVDGEYDEHQYCRRNRVEGEAVQEA